MLGERALGLARKKVRLVPHRTVWSGLFVREKQLLKKTFGARILAIEHIGSTAIPGIAAKPIIDMIVVVRSLRMANGMKRAFARLGYSIRHRPGWQWQVLYAKGPETRRTHYAHVVPENGRTWRNDVLFRDYLRTHRSSALQYEALKKRLASRYRNDRSKYGPAKRRFIVGIIRKARRESDSNKNRGHRR